jgi:hypothetical protein
MIDSDWSKTRLQCQGSESALKTTRSELDFRIDKSTTNFSPPTQFAKFHLQIAVETGGQDVDL